MRPAASVSHPLTLRPPPLPTMRNHNAGNALELPLYLSDAEQASSSSSSSSSDTHEKVPASPLSPVVMLRGASSAGSSSSSGSGGGGGGGSIGGGGEAKDEAAEKAVAGHHAGDPTSEATQPRPQPPQQEHAFVPALEGLRGVAIALVLVSHLWPPFSFFSWNLGMMGVTVFFVLSGYLITGILLHMQRRDARDHRFVHLPLFFASRTVRLAPSLVLCVAATVLLWINQGRSFVNIRGHALTTLLYLENVFCKRRGHKDQVLAHAWTLAVEEQFYIVWAVALPFISTLRERGRMVALACLASASVVYRLSMLATRDMDMMSKSLTSNAYALLAGSALRLVAQPLPAWTSTRRAGVAGQLLFAGVVLLMRLESVAESGAVWGPFLTVPATALTITSAVGSGDALLECAPLRHLGRVSYSFYLWHHVLLWFCGLFNQLSIPSLGVVALSWVVAEYSTVHMEEPIRERFKATAWFRNQKRRIAACA